MDICNNVTCPDGNCIGCKNGEVWCQDPRCCPNCPGEACIYPEDHDFNATMIIILIIICLVTILFIVWFVYGPQFFVSHDDHTLANVVR